MSRRSAILLFFLLTLAPAAAAAQTTTAQGDTAQGGTAQPGASQRLDAFVAGEAVAADARSEDLALPAAPEPTTLDGPTQQKYLDALKEYYQYRISGYGHRQHVFEWQLLSSKVIFVVVLVLVAAGIYFSAIQFHAGLRRPPGTPTAAEDVTEITASLKEIKVRSPVLGVVTLVISLAFFYLYLVYVYPIEEIF